MCFFFIQSHLDSGSFSSGLHQAPGRAGVIRQLQTGLCASGAGESREWPKRNDLADFSGAQPRRAETAGSGVLRVAVPGAISVRADSIGFDFACPKIALIASQRPG